MSLETVNHFCATLPGAELTDPWGDGHHAWKVGGKMFASVGVLNVGVSVKCADVETAALLIEMGRAVKAPYFHRSWVQIGWGQVDDEELCERLATSHGLILSKLPKKVQAELLG